MLEDHSSYHQSITREEAEKRLKKCGGHCYLTRFSRTNEKYILSVYQEKPTKTIEHYKITIHECVRLEDKGKSFSNIAELLTFYENNRVSPAFKNIGQCYSEDEYERDYLGRYNNY